MSRDQVLIEAGPDLVELTPEEMSFRNMVHFHSEELRQIQNGTRAIISSTRKDVYLFGTHAIICSQARTKHHISSIY